MSHDFCNFAFLMRRNILAALLLCIYISSSAQEHTTDSTDVFWKHLELGEVVVTGLVGDTRVKEMATPISVIPATELRSRASSNIIGTIAREPGISEITTGGGISKPVIRGLSYNRVVVVNDGIRQEGQQWGDEHGIEIDGASVHSVEILKGPASLMYGSDALAGVIIFRPEPVAMPGTVSGDVSAEYQSNNGLAAYSVHASGNSSGWIWDARFSDKNAHAYSNRYDGAVPNSGFAERAASAMFGRNAKWGYSRLRASYYHLTPGIIEGERDPLTGELEGGGIGYVPGLPFQQVRHFKVVSDNTVHIGTGDLKAIVGWQQNRRQEFEESADVCGLDFRLNTLNYDFRYQATIAGDWKFAAGIGGMLQESENLGDEYLIPAYRLLDAGLFSTASKTLGQWTVTGGLRADVRLLGSEALEDRFKAFDRTFNGVSASIGAVRPLGDSFTLRLNAARGFRAPNLSELGSNGEHEGTLRYEIGNTELKPEYSLQADLGLDFTSKYVSVQSALFVSRIDNYIFAARNGAVSDEGLPVYAFMSGTAHLKGAEISLDIHPVHSLHIGSAFSCVYAREAGGDDLPLIPAPRLFSEIKYEFSHGGCTLSNSFLALNLDWNFAQNHFYAKDDTETATRAYALLGLSAGADIMYRRHKLASVYLIGSNLTDEAYQPHLSRLKYAEENPVTGRRGVFSMGRNITVKLVVPIGRQ